ncbi:MAG TPA: hypothetical protein VMB83_10500, partial [Roseiarcus sp.]|nr:hypothetical protein [Roseiarcus sp.]
LVEQGFQRFGRYGRAGQPSRMTLGRWRLEPGLRRFAQAAPPLRKGGIEQLGEMPVERLHVRA